MTQTVRPLLLLLLASLVPGVACLHEVDTGPLGYQCEDDADCDGLLCSAGRCAEDTIEPVLRLRGSGGNQLLTFQTPASEALLQDGSYTSDGPVLQASSRELPDLVAVFQLREPEDSDYLLTVNPKEVESAQRTYGYVSEGTAFYAHKAGSERGLPVYRLQRQGFHHYAIDTVERDQMVSAGWAVEFELLRAEPPGP